MPASSGEKDLKKKDSYFIHVTWLPSIKATGEIKTKPTQHSVRELRSIGISPNMIIARSDHEVADDLREKIALFCDVQKEAVIEARDADILYEVVLNLEEQHLDDLVLKHFRLSLTLIF